MKQTVFRISGAPKLLILSDLEKFETEKKDRRVLVQDMVVVANSKEHAAVTYAPLDQEYDPTLSGELKPLKAAQEEELPWEGEEHVQLTVGECPGKMN